MAKGSDVIRSREHKWTTISASRTSDIIDLQLILLSIWIDANFWHSFMSLQMSFLRTSTLVALHLSTLLGLAGSTYILRSRVIELSEDHEARMVCRS